MPGVGMPPTQKYASSFRSLIASLSFDRIEALALGCPAPGMPHRLEHAKGDLLGGAVRDANRHALPFQVSERVDAGALDRDDVHAVGVRHHERPHRHRPTRELALPCEALQRHIGRGKRHDRRLLVHELQIRHRAGGGLGVDRIPRHVLRQDVRHPAPEQGVDTARRTGRDRDRDSLLRRGCRGEAQGHDTNGRACDASHADSLPYVSPSLANSQEEQTALCPSYHLSGHLLP